jgi:hypothetical protein
VLDQVDPHETFIFCQRLLAGYDDRPGPEPVQIFSDTADKLWRDGDWSVRADSPWTLRNEPDQGLPAWLMLHYRPGAALRTDAEAAEHNEDCDDDCTGQWHEVACWLSVDFDTTYSYRDRRGWGCGDLHAAIVAELGQWLTARGVRWSWRNEFTGEVHDGPDRLSELGSGGEDAATWFRTAALPAILADVVASGGGEFTVGGVTVQVPGLGERSG